ncbi:MAG: hypothetical protein HYX34_01235 [Actinobacteria bacterium]|nr:hypothetical protein [Actinomycetota bacterium]
MITSDRTDVPALHSLAWLAWALAAAASVQIAPSPLYVAVVVAVCLAVVMVHRRPEPAARAFPVLLGLATTFVAVRVVLTVLTVHGSGGAGVLVRLPQITLPRLLGGFAVGGAVSWSVAWQAAAEGLVVVGVMAAFGAFNAVASPHELLQRVPRAFHEPALVLSVALAFVPATMEAAAAVREADRARTAGQAVRRGRLVRQVVPVLETGLERAVHLAESMDARGFGRAAPAPGEQVAAWVGLAGTLSLGGALVALVGRASTVALLLGGAGLGCLALAVAFASVGWGRSPAYRRRATDRRDRLVALAALAAPVGLVVFDRLGDGSLRWRAALPLRPPTLHAGPVAALLLLAAPLLVAPGGNRGAAPGQEAGR